MGQEWKIKDVGESEYFLGMQVQQDIDKGTIRFTQRPYWEHVLNRFNLTNIPSRNTPLPVGITLEQNMSPKTDSERKEMADKPYRPILGCVMWGQLATRPDLSFAVSLLSLVSKLILESNTGKDFCMCLGTSRTLWTMV